MDEEQFDDLVRGLAWRVPRRSVPLLVAAAAGASLLLIGEEATATKKRKRKRRRDNKGNNKENNFKEPSPQTCAESCASNCALCIQGLGAPTRCGGSVNIFCNFYCGSDDDCALTEAPHCVSQWVERATGKVTTGADTCAGASAPSPGYCVQIEPCA